MKSNNLEEFQSFVLDSTDDKGVHFVMADGVSEVANLYLNCICLYVIFAPIAV